MTSSVTGRTRELTFPKIPTVSTAFGKRRHNCARISIHVLPSCGGQLYRRIFKVTPSRTRWAFHPYPGCRFSSTSFTVQVQAVRPVSVQIDPIFLIGPVGCLPSGLFPFIYRYYRKFPIYSLPVNIINAKTRLFSLQSSIAFSSSCQGLLSACCWKIFLSALLKAYFSHHPWPDCLSILGQKKSTFWQKMYDQREINNLMFN